MNQQAQRGGYTVDNADSSEEIAFVARREHARLIASAPELVEALRACLALLEDDGTQGGRTWTIKSARAALAKAEGSKP